MELIEVFADQGHSKISAGIVSGMFNYLCKADKLGTHDDTVKELNKMGAFDSKTDFYGGFTGEAILALADIFIEQKHTNETANVVCDLFSKLAKYQPLTPLLGTDNEWVEIADGEMLQNIRCPDVFKYKKTDQAYYYDVIIWKQIDSATGIGTTYIGPVNGVDSTQPIKFPFIPKSFVIEVTGVEDQKIVHPNKLEEALKYYK